jgi:hypothetical protein
VGLFYGAILLFVYSFYEMVFDFLTVWILFWAVLGMLNTDRENADSRRAGPIFLLVVLLSLLALFYIVYSTHTALQFYKPHDTITLVTALPNERNIRDYLDSLPSSRAFPRWQISAILFMHKWDPDVLAALARATEDHNPHLSNQLFLESIQLDPASTDDKRQYILFVASHPQFVDRLTAPGLMHLLFQTATERQTSVIKPIINYQSPFFIGAFIELMHGSKAIAVNWHFFSKFYYLWGLSVMRTDPNAVVPLLSEAALLEPVWSYYHLELASYALYRLKNQNLANKTLSACQQLPFAGEDCLFFSSQPLPISGYYKQKIIDIH